MSLKNNAFATRQNYIRGVRNLMIHYNRLPEDCTVDEIKGYLVFVRDQKTFSSSTINLRVCGLKYYFRHVVHRLDLVTKIPNPRIQKYDFDILNFEEVALLQRCCRDMRQFLIISILYDTGIRVRELIRIRPSDFDKHHRTIMIRNSKGKKTRVVHYGETLRDTLNKFCKVRGSLPENTLLESYKEKNKPLTIRGMQYIVRQIAKRSGIKKKISPHTFRHTFAVHYLNAGGSLFHLQKLLGHENITTTLHYLKYAKLPEGTRCSILDILMDILKNKKR